MIFQKNMRIVCDQIGLQKFSISIIYALYKVVEELHVKGWQ